MIHRRKKGRELLFSQPSRGFTLVEALLSMVVLSIIVVACGSAMRLMSRGLAARDNTLESQTAAGRSALDQIRDDLKVALTVPEQTATALTVYGVTLITRLRAACSRAKADGGAR